MPLKILVVEDEQDIQTLVKMTLQFTDKHEVTVVNNGQAALDEAARSKPDLILLDVMMPKMDGFETLRRLKAGGATRDVPVIFLTARAQAGEIEQGVELGAIGYITKPFDAMQLNEQIAEYLARLNPTG